MKSPLIIGVSALALLTLSATLFAQTATGSSLISQMKAATHAFTLAGDLNPGATGLESSPLVGKRTGDMLSAGEYNRLLELVGQGGGGTNSKIILANGSKQSTTGGTGSATLSDSASLSEKGLIVISGYASRTYSGSVANAGEYARIFVDDELCSVDMGFEGGTSNVTFHSSTSCVKMLEPGNHTVRFENVPSGPSRVMTTSMSWAVIAEKISSGISSSGGGNSGGGINLTEQTYTNISLPNESGAGPYFISCTKADAAYYCGMKGSIIVSMTCKDVGINMVLGINHNSGAWTTDDHYVAGGANRAIDVLKCASGIGTITDAKE